MKSFYIVFHKYCVNMGQIIHQPTNSISGIKFKRWKLKKLSKAGLFMVIIFEIFL